MHAIAAAAILMPTCEGQVIPPGHFGINSAIYHAIAPKRVLYKCTLKLLTNPRNKKNKNKNQKKKENRYLPSISDGKIV